MNVGGRYSYSAFEKNRDFDSRVLERMEKSSVWEVVHGEKRFFEDNNTESDSSDDEKELRKITLQRIFRN